jgi:hypothetical protein
MHCQNLKSRLLANREAKKSNVQRTWMNERSYAPGFYDLIFGMLRDARIVPNVSQTAADLSTVISLVGAQMGVAILPASAVTYNQGCDFGLLAHPCLDLERRIGDCKSIYCERIGTWRPQRRLPPNAGLRQGHRWQGAKQEAVLSDAH